jgi:hypothetical protein
MDVPFPKQGAAPAYLDQMKALLKRHPGTRRSADKRSCSHSCGHFERSRDEECLFRHLVGRGSQVRCCEP